MSFKLTEGHWNVLLEFMEQHKEFAKGQFSGPTGRIIQRKLWEELAQLLNSLGEGSKPVEKWQKTWSDIKYSIKRKASAKKQDIAATGGGPKVKPKLNQLEERVVNILGKTFYEGVSVSECGIPSTSEDDFLSTSKDVFPQNSLEDTPIHLPVASTSSIQTSKFSEFKHKSIEASDHGYSKLPHPKKRKIQDVENELMQESLTELKEIKLELRELNKSMSSIANSLAELVAKK
ncbi:uncharacterized protein [Diabrotica undecimpunctata]|uniref:uncharacterized protein n=1 Tax=Diabrotica undecimpunctata TaxID=50387 RepID=UPI003B6336CC